MWLIYLFRVLKAFGLGDRFISFIKLCYIDVSSFININQGRSLAQIRRGAVPHEQVPVPGVNFGVNVVDPGPSVPIQSKCVCKVSLYIEMKLCIYHIFLKINFCTCSN